MMWFILLWFIGLFSDLDKNHDLIHIAQQDRIHIYDIRNICRSTISTMQTASITKKLSVYIYLVIEISNRSKNWTRDVWYMQLTCGMSHIKKYKTLPRVATGRNSSRAALIFNSVSLAVLSFLFISAAVCFVIFKTDINSTSSIKGPFERIKKQHRKILYIVLISELFN